MVPRFVWVLFLASAAYAHARQEAAPNTYFTWIWPVERAQAPIRPQPQAQPQQKVQSGLSEAGRFRAAQHAIEEQEKERRASLVMARLKAAAQPPVDPEKNDYLKYLADKREEEEAKYDPIVAEVRAVYKPEEFDEFKKWKASQPPVQEKQPTATQPAHKELDLSKFLDWDASGKPRAKPKPRPQEEEE